MSFATVTITMACLIIMGSFGLLVVNINALISDLEDENEVVAFIDESLTEEEARAVEPLIEAVPNVSGADFMSRAEAMENFQEDYDEDLFDSLGRDGLPPQVHHPPHGHQPDGADKAAH